MKMRLFTCCGVQGQHAVLTATCVHMSTLVSCKRTLLSRAFLSPHTRTSTNIHSLALARSLARSISLSARCRAARVLYQVFLLILFNYPTPRDCQNKLGDARAPARAVCCGDLSFSRRQNGGEKQFLPVCCGD